VTCTVCEQDPCANPAACARVLEDPDVADALQQAAQNPTPAPSMTVREAGRLGGQRRREQIGREGFRQLGQAGGAVTAARGPNFYREIGRKGGAARKAQLGAAGYAELGRRGGGRSRRAEPIPPTSTEQIERIEESGAGFVAREPAEERYTKED